MTTDPREIEAAAKALYEFEFGDGEWATATFETRDNYWIPQARNALAAAARVRVDTTPEPPLTVTDRGFKHLEPVQSEYGGHVRVYESSAASAPHIWLNATCPVDLNDPTGPSRDAVAHLTVENAVKLAAQLQWLVANHYQGPVGRASAAELRRRAVA